MTTTELIEMLQGVERGASNRSREVSLLIKNTKKFISTPDIEIYSTGDGVAGAELTLLVHANKQEKQPHTE